MISTPEKPRLVRAIGRWTLAALVLNCIIGAGIFTLPRDIAKYLGPMAPWGYAIVAAGMAVLVAVFAEVSSQYRETGGQYLYARDALGRFAGIQVGWFFWLTRVSAGAAIANTFVSYLSLFWPAAAGGIPRAAVLTVMIGGLAAINFVGVRAGAGLATFFTLAKLAPLGAFVIVGLWRVTPVAAPALAAPIALRDWTEALLALVFAYGGFEVALIPAAETKNPRHDTPFALYVGLATVTVCYVLGHLVTMWALPDLVHSQRPLADAARVFAGSLGAIVITIGALLAALGWHSAAFVTSARLPFALAERGDFPALLAAVHPRFRTPHVSILLWAVLVLALALGGGFLWNAVLSAVARLVTYGVTCVALLQLRRIRPEADRWRAPGGRLLAIIGLAFCLVLVAQMNVDHAWIVTIVALVALINWLVVRTRPPLSASTKTA